MIFLDTHIFVHLMFGEPVRFGEEYLPSGVAVSAVTAAEVGCLQRLGRIELPEPADEWFEAAIRRTGATVLPVTAGTFARAGILVWEHRDPADRILVQTLIERPNAELHTRDARIIEYARIKGLNVRDCRI